MVPSKGGHRLGSTGADRENRICSQLRDNRQKPVNQIAVSRKYLSYRYRARSARRVEPGCEQVAAIQCFTCFVRDCFVVSRVLRLRESLKETHQAWVRHADPSYGQANVFANLFAIDFFRSLAYVR